MAKWDELIFSLHSDVEEPLVEFSKRHASPCQDLARFDMDGKRYCSIDLSTVRESFAYKGILANGFHFQRPSMVSILNHYPMAIESSARPS